MAMKALIDGDVLVYKAGFASEDRIYQVIDDYGEVLGEFSYKKEVDEFINFFLPEDIEVEIHKTSDPDPIEAALSNTKKLLNNILEKTGCEEYSIYLTGEGNFREDIATILPYKGNRTAAKPHHYENIRSYLLRQWGAEMVPYQEADDAMGIEQYQDFLKGWKSNLTPEGEGVAPEDLGTIICTIDKDLDMIPGWHYNLDSEEIYWITEKGGIRKFYEQLLTGDKVDNIRGIPGCGPAKAKKILGDLSDEMDLFLACYEAYKDYFRKKNEVPGGDEQGVEFVALWDLWENANLLWIRRDNNEEYWEPPHGWKEEGLRVHNTPETTISESVLAGAKIQDSEVQELREGVDGKTPGQSGPT